MRHLRNWGDQLGPPRVPLGDPRMEPLGPVDERMPFASVSWVPESTAQLSTSLLRTSQEQPYRGLRELLPAKGVDPMADVLADIFPDHVDQEFGVVVTTARRVFTFVLYYGRRGDLKRRAADAVIGDWVEMTDWWQGSPYHEQVAAALQLLGKD